MNTPTKTIPPAGLSVTLVNTIHKIRVYLQQPFQKRKNEKINYTIVPWLYGIGYL